MTEATQLPGGILGAIFLIIGLLLTVIGTSMILYALWRLWTDYRRKRPV